MIGDSPKTPPKAPREAESLLEQLAESALDNAYYEVDRTREPTALMRIFTLVSIIFLGFLFAVVAVQFRNDRPATETERQALIDNIAGRQEIVDSRRETIALLEDEIDVLTAQVSTPSEALQRDRLNAAGEAVVGEGVEVTLNSASGESTRGIISDLDVQLVVNGLWMSGAEAIDVGGNRLASTSAIRSAGEGITVNFQSIAEPIVIRAIGSPNGLTKQFEASPSGRYLTEREQNSGISWTIQESDEIQMAAAPSKRLEIRHARAVRRGGS